MKFLNKFNIFNKKKNKIPFSQVLTNLQKFIDLECPDEILGQRIYFVKIEKITNDNKPFYFKSLTYQQNTSFISNIQSIECQSILIKLEHDEDSFFAIILSYNKDEKFDMITWESCYVANNIKIIKNRVIDDELNPLYEKVREYLIENNLVGPVI
jgi:hypothetical protein